MLNCQQLLDSACRFGLKQGCFEDACAARKEILPCVLKSCLTGASMPFMECIEKILIDLTA